MGKSHQVLGKRCQGIGEAVVEVWYAGLNPHPDRCHCNVPNDTQADYCYTTSTDPYPQQLHPDAIPQLPELYGPQMCYSPEHWYRGKTTTNAEGKYVFQQSFICHFRKLERNSRQVREMELETPPCPLFPFFSFSLFLFFPFSLFLFFLFFPFSPFPSFHERQSPGGSVW